MKIELNEEQDRLKIQIKELYTEVMGYVSGKKVKVLYDVINMKVQEMGDMSHVLHTQLDPEPKHHKYLIQNRGLNPSHPEFYYQIHAVQDLLKYLEDSNANNDPIDVTLGETFNFKIYSRRWGHYDLYELTRNQDGWYVSHLMQEGQAGKNADPVLSYILRNDSVSYPRNLSDIMEDIWIRAEDEGLTKQEVQTMLNKVADWIEVVEKNYPDDIAR